MLVEARRRRARWRRRRRTGTILAAKCPRTMTPGCAKRGPASARTCDRQRGHCPLGNAGGCLASCHVAPAIGRAAGRFVGPRWPGARTRRASSCRRARSATQWCDDVSEKLRSRRGATYDALHRCAFATDSVRGDEQAKPAFRAVFACTIVAFLTGSAARTGDVTPSRRRRQDGRRSVLPSHWHCGFRLQSAVHRATRRGGACL